MNKTYILPLAVCAALLLSGCVREEIGMDGIGDGDGKVTLNLSYRDVSAKEVTVTKATDPENALNNLQVFIFDVDGKLKGYKYEGNASNLNQKGKVGTISVKTSVGKSYIYAVANAPEADIYSITEYADGETLPTNNATWIEEYAQEKKIDFTLADLKRIQFKRTNGEININTSDFLMSGTANSGELCEIAKNTSDGSVYIVEEDKVIKLHRVVAKVTFNIKSGSQDGKTISFTPSSYDICNVTTAGMLVEGETLEDGVASFEDFTGRSFSAEEPGTFEVYLPENIQATTATISDVHAREADEVELGSDGKKVFTCAPANGTYVVLYGDYTEKDGDNLEKTATVKYYVHLGDFGSDVSDFKVKRNYHYTYDVTVEGVDKIVTQVTTKDDTVQPGAEGIVMKYNGGKAFTVDAHYDYCVMKFNQTDIKYLKENVGGYVLRVRGLDESGNFKESKSVVIKGNGTSYDAGDFNGVDYEWVRFIPGGKYDSSDDHGGDDLGYKYLRDEQTNAGVQGYESGSTGVGLTVVELLQHLYDIADDSGKWDSDGTLTYTCYVNENYYSTLSWDKYVNQDPRVLYIADNVTESPDGRSLYAEVAYSLSQYSIQTFYNTDYSGSIVAYGLETIRDDNKEALSDRAPGNGNSSWDGLANMKSDIPTYWDVSGFDSETSYTWTHTYQWVYKRSGREQIFKEASHSGTSSSYIEECPDESAHGSAPTYFYSEGRRQVTGTCTLKTVSFICKKDVSSNKVVDYTQFRQACMSRNRDLDGDGVIDDDEVRWYCPAIDQYAGMWIGENAISDVQARLYTLSTSKLSNYSPETAEHYYSNTYGTREFWAEEGMATGNGDYLGESYITQIRCIRNVQSGSEDSPKEGLVTANEYYVYNDMTIDLSRLDVDAVRTSVISSELRSHSERGVSDREVSSPRIKFTVASKSARDYDTKTTTEKYTYYSNVNGVEVPMEGTRTVTNYVATDAEWWGEASALVSGDITPCNAAYSEKSGQSDKGTWRTPNQRELSLMFIVDKSSSVDDNTLVESNDGCRTKFSNTGYNYSWRVHFGYPTTDIINMIKESDDVRVRCVKDVE